MPKSMSSIKQRLVAGAKDKISPRGESNTIRGIARPTYLIPMDIHSKGSLEAPEYLAPSVHDLYFKPKYEEFRPRTIWSLSNVFTSAFN
jgi:hypothetical protein